MALFVTPPQTPSTFIPLLCSPLLWKQWCMVHGWRAGSSSKPDQWHPAPGMLLVCTSLSSTKPQCFSLVGRPVHLHIPTAGSNKWASPANTDTRDTSWGCWRARIVPVEAGGAVAENPNLDISISHCWKKTAFFFFFPLMLLVLFSNLGWAEVAFLCCFSFGCYL